MTENSEVKEIEIEGKNIVLVIADTLTALHLPMYGYERDTAPFMEKLADENLIFKNTYSNAPWTPPSHASIFSGKLPSEHGTNTGNKAFTSNSFVEELREKGYNTVGISANQLVSEHLNFDKGFETFHEVFNFDTNDSEVLKEAASRELSSIDVETLKKGFKFLYNKVKRKSNRGAASIERLVKKEINSSENPNFLFLNYTEPHSPYSSPDKYAGIFTDNPSKKVSRNIKDHYNSNTPEIFYEGFPNCTDQEIVDLYDGTIRYLDSKLERLYEYLNEELDDLVFIVASDHGENFGEQGAYLHQCGIWEKSVRVPLIIAGDGVPNQTIDSNFSLRKIRNLILDGEVKTSPTVFAEYAGWNKMRGLVQEDREDYGGQKKTDYAFNKSKFIIRKNEALVKNSELDDLQFQSGQKYLSKDDCLDDKEKLENKLDLILGDFN